MSFAPDSPVGFVPSAAQKRLLAAFIAANDTTDIAEMGRELSISPQEFHDWLRDADFADWWAEQTEAAIRAKRASVHLALTRKAQSGDLAAIKIWLQRFDRLDAGDNHNVEAYRRLLDRFARRAGIEHHPYQSESADELDAQPVP